MDTDGTPSDEAVAFASDIVRSWISRRIGPIRSLDVSTTSGEQSVDFAIKLHDRRNVGFALVFLYDGLSNVPAAAFKLERRLDEMHREGRLDGGEVWCSGIEAVPDP